MFAFKQQHTFEKRKKESTRIKIKYPDRIPVIVEKNDKSKIEQIDRNKFLVPNDLTVGQFAYVIRKRINLNHEQAMFLFINNIIPPTNALINVLYDERCDDDGFLYMTYSGENTFGSLTP